MPPNATAAQPEVQLLISHLTYSAHRNVSIKILDAESSAGDNRELGMLQHLSNTGHSSHPGSKHVAQLRDWFYHEGPNGKHLCLVLALLGPRLSLVVERSENHRIDGKLARRISRQLLLATDYLHSIGIAHGVNARYASLYRADI